MNPLCLLTKGRTFKDMGDRTGAYKMLGTSVVPKYGTCKQPSSRIPHTAPQAGQKSLFEEAPKVVTVTVDDVPVVVAALMEPAAPPQPTVSKSPFAEGAKTSKRSSARGTWKRIDSFCKGLVQRFVFGRKRRPARESSVQAELALDKVTVLRNDLNEDDLEVVLVERKVGTGEKPLARLSKMEMTTEAWSRLTAPFRKKSSESVFSPKAETRPAPELSAQV